MPDVGQRGSRWFTTAHLFTVAAGISGVTVGGNGSVQEQLGSAYVAIWTWSALFAASGSLGIIARARHWYRAETTAADVTCVGVLLWALLMFSFTPPWSALWQVAIWMLGSVAHLHGWAVYRRARLDDRARLLKEAHRSLAEE